MALKDRKRLLAYASPARSADSLAGFLAPSETARYEAQKELADIPLSSFVEEPLVPEDPITDFLFRHLDVSSFSKIKHMSIGEFREWLIAPKTQGADILKISNGLLPEMVSSVSKIMRNQDLIRVSRKISVISRFRSTMGLPGHFSSRLQPNHPYDDEKAILTSILDGLALGSGDAMIGINPATDSIKKAGHLLEILDELIQKLHLPTQSCVLTHYTNSKKLIKAKAPLDLVFQSIGGTEKLNRSFGVDLKELKEVQELALDLGRNPHGQIFYFETGQGAALSSQAHHGLDAQTCETRAYGVARAFNPFLVNSVVGFIGPEYLFDGTEIIRAGLEDLFCGKVMGLPMGIDVCYTNHAHASSQDMDALLTLLATAGCCFVMGVPGADDLMLHYQSTSFHDILYIRELLDLKAAPEFQAWCEERQILSPQGRFLEQGQHQRICHFESFYHQEKGLFP